MSHSPALETPSPSATTPSTPVFRNLINERNPSKSPPHVRDDKFLYQPHAPDRDKKDHHQSDKDGLVAERSKDSHERDRQSHERDKERNNHQQQESKRDSNVYALDSLVTGKDDHKHHLSATKSSHRLSSGLQVSLNTANASVSTSTPLGNFGTGLDLQWHNAVQTPGGPGGPVPPHSPGALSWAGDGPGATSSDKFNFQSSETGLGVPRLSRKESYKAQRQHYRREKKRAASALLSSLEDPAVVILADWLKVRGSLKSWTKLWCVLKPGLLLLYKSPKAKSNHWVGTLLLTACQVIERPSKKDGFCFKLYNPLEQSIWAPRGPHNETLGAVVQPLPTAHLIFRAPSQAAGKCWLDGLELALKCSNMLLKSGASSLRITDVTTNHETQWSPEDLEKHFHEHADKLVAMARTVTVNRSSPLLYLSDSPKVSPTKARLVTKRTPVHSMTTSISNLRKSITKWRQILENIGYDFAEDSPVLVGYDFDKEKSTIVESAADCKLDMCSGGKFTEVSKKINEVLFIQKNQPESSNEVMLKTGFISDLTSTNIVKKKEDKDNAFNIDFFKKNTICTASLRTKMFMRDKKHPKNLAITPMRHLKRKSENPREKVAILSVSRELKQKIRKRTKSEERSSSILIHLDSPPTHAADSRRQSADTGSFFEDNLLRVVSAFPKRRSSTPSAFFKIGNKEECETKAHSLFSKYRLEQSGESAKFDPMNKSCNEISISKLDMLKKRHLNVSYLSGRKSAEPRMNNVVSASPFKRIEDSRLKGSRERVSRSVALIHAPSGRVPTPDKFSLINYDRLPSVSLSQRLGEHNAERQSQQNLYVSGKIIRQHDLDGAEMTESDSDAGHAACGDLVVGDVAVNLLTVERIAARVDALYKDEVNDDVGQSGEVVEELGEENKSLLWFLVKQVRPGMDLSKVVLPTFILEPRSFLDKLSDSFYHSDILANAWRHQDPFERMKTVVRWYLSGLYRKPRGLKKPYNPVLGETFRCCWRHPESNTYTYYVAEQVSHHPPISAFYVSNRKEGFAIEASILAKSKFYGNSTSAILEGVARVTLLPLAETYLCTSPYAHCKGLLLGTLSMELGGRVVISCPLTNYSAEIEFRLKPFIGGADSINMVSGRIRHNKDTLATVEGHWDGRIDIKDRKHQEDTMLLDVAELKGRRLRRRLVRPQHLGDFESQRLWQKVSQAIANEDQVAATCEKTIVEEAQRERARGLTGSEWVPRYFKKAPSLEGSQPAPLHGLEPANLANNWQYMHTNLLPWDDSVDILEYESEFIMKTLQRQPGIAPESPSLQPLQHLQMEHSGSESDSTNSHHHRTPTQGHQTVAAALIRVEAALRDHGTELAGVKALLRRLQPPRPAPAPLMGPVAFLLLALFTQTFLCWFFSR